MGGRALKHLNVGRISAADMAVRMKKFDVIADVITSNGTFFLYQYPMPLYGKEDYGDLDIVYTTFPENVERVREQLLAVFESKGFVKNGQCTSIEWEGLQVDMIYAPIESFDWTANWYSHGDASAIKGRIYRYYNYKFGHDGLYYNAKTKSFSKDILVTRDWVAGHKLMNWKATSLFHMYKREDVFEYVLTHPYLHSEVYEEVKPTDRPRKDQLDFYELVKEKLETADRTVYPRSYGLHLLRKFSIKVWLQVRCELLKMNLREAYNPLRKKYRKFIWTKLNPFLFKLRGML